MYPGMYQVEKAWCCSGLSGFLVWKFAMKRCPGQAPPPWTILDAASPSKESIMSDKFSDVGKSDSGFDSDETGSHFGSQESSSISCHGSEDGRLVKSDVDEEEENETIRTEERDSEDKETKIESEEEKLVNTEVKLKSQTKENETDITEVKQETEIEEEKS